MQIVSLIPELYPLWNAACLEMDEAWFWHTAEWLEYSLQYRPDLQPQSSSFMVTNENRVLAICPLILETQTMPEGILRQFSYGGGAGLAPALANDLSEKVRKATLSVVCEELDARAKNMAVKRVSFRTSPPAPVFWRGGIPKPNPLFRFGFLDIPLATQVIDLSKNETELLSDMRKGHRYDVKRSLQMLPTEIYDATNITPEIFDQYRSLHYRAAGRLTRPLATFEMMQDWIQSGKAILAHARHQDQIVGCALISVYKNGAYYSSGCEEPSFNHLPIGHALQWAAMRWMKAHGVTFYEIGIQPSGAQLHSLFSEKELNISLFKRGFGGTTVTFWVGEKFYSREYYQEVMRDRIEKLASIMPTALTSATV